MERFEIVPIEGVPIRFDGELLGSSVGHLIYRTNGGKYVVEGRDSSSCTTTECFVGDDAQDLFNRLVSDVHESDCDNPNRAEGAIARVYDAFEDAGLDVAWVIE